MQNNSEMTTPTTAQRVVADIQDAIEGASKWQHDSAAWRHHDVEGAWAQYIQPMLERTRATIARLEGDIAETKEKLWAITDIDKWPTTEQVAAAMRRIPKRDHDIIDRHFDHGATLMTAAKWEMRKAQQRADAAERRVEAVTALVAVMEQMAAHAYEHWNADRDAKVGKILGALASHRPGYSITLDAARQAVTEADTALAAASGAADGAATTEG